MHARLRRQWHAVALLVVGAAVAAFVAAQFVDTSDEEAIVAAFNEVEVAWPPIAPVSLEQELENTRAMRRITGADYAPGAPRPDGGVQTDDRGLLVRTGVVEGLYYVEAVFGGARFEDTLPMAVLIHGRADRARIPGGPFFGLGAPIRVIVPQAPDPLGEGFQWLPVRVGSGLVDQLTTALMARASQLASMLRELSAQVPTAGKPIVVGFSQGAMLTFTLALHHSDVVGDAFPLAGWLPPALVPPYRREDMPFPRIRSMHGRADEVILLGPTEELFETLSQRGFEVELVPIAGAGHEMTADMNAQLHAWLDEALGAVVAQGVLDGVLDGGMPPCPDAGWPEGGWPEGGWPDGSAPVPCGGAALDAGLDGGVPR